MDTGVRKVDTGDRKMDTGSRGGPHACIVVALSWAPGLIRGEGTKIKGEGDGVDSMPECHHHHHRHVIVIIIIIIVVIIVVVSWSWC